jgi:hypothetical protein
MEFSAARKLGACLARDYSEAVFRLLVNYSDVSASEAASRLGLHIRTVQDFLETLVEVGVAKRKEVYEKKRPYFRYSLVRQKIHLEIDFGLLFSNDSGRQGPEKPLRERKGSGARFSTARSGQHISAVSFWKGQGRDRKERRVSLTTPQGRFLYHLPFPTAEPMSVSAIMEAAGLGEEHRGEILDLVGLLKRQGVIEEDES